MASITPLARGVAGRCPNCGARGVFAGPWELRERCPTCQFSFVREQGYWVGAMTVAMALVILAFFVTFLGGMLVTWPDVPWTTLTIITAVVNVVVSLGLYGWSKTIWVGLDLAFNPPTVVEEAEMLASAATDPTSQPGGEPTTEPTAPPGDEAAEPRQ